MTRISLIVLPFTSDAVQGMLLKCALYDTARHSVERRMIVRIALIIVAALLTLLIVRPASADDARDQKAAAERRQVELQVRQVRLNALKARQFGRVVVDEPEEEFIDEEFGDVIPRERPAPQLVTAKATRLPTLRLLSLEITRVTDAGLVHVAELKRLKHLDLANTLVTNAGVAELQRALPDVVVIR